MPAMLSRPRRACCVVARCLLLAGMIALGGGAVRAEEESREDPPKAISVAQALELANDSRPAIVRVQWRRSKAPRDVTERHAVIVDPRGWLLMAGPRPSPDGTLAARFEDGRAMRAEVWASDPLTCLTLLRVPATRLPPLSFRTVPGVSETSETSKSRRRRRRRRHRRRRGPRSSRFAGRPLRPS